MAFHILIVDDEPIIRRGLCDTIPWEQNQIQVVGAACDGKEAIQKIKNHPQIDLVITDIRMPNMDGLELASFLQHHHPSIQMIIISGYEEFAYAQKALRLGVKNYLLKPVNVDELLTVVNRIKTQVLMEKAESARMYKDQLKNTIYRSIMELEEGDEFASFENIRLQPFITSVYYELFSIDNLDKQAHGSVKEQWKQAIDKQFAEEGTPIVSIFTEENVLLSCLIHPTMPSKEIIERIEKTTEALPFSLYTVLGKEGCLFRSIRQEYRAMVSCVLDSSAADLSTFMFSSRSVVKSHTLPYPEKLEHAFISALFQLDISRQQETIDELFFHFRKHNFSLREAANVCRTMIMKVLEQYEELFYKTPGAVDLFHTEGINVTFYNTLPVLKGLLEEDTKKLIEHLRIKKGQNKDWLMVRAEEYIKTYSASDIKAHEVADFINISPNYFSSLFKQATGQTFNEYVNTLRIEEAKTLLAETPFKVNEIAGQVGYKEYKYFVEVFKKVCGITPTIYRKMLSEKH